MSRWRCSAIRCRPARSWWFCILGPISGAHFNPAVSLVFALKGELTPRDALGYVAAQVAGGIAGTMVAHAMFALPLIDASLKMRTGGESRSSPRAVAAFGLVATIPVAGTGSTAQRCRGWSASTSRRPTGSRPRPRLPIRRCHRALDDQYVFGHSPADLPGFIAAELCGAVVALIFMNWLLRGAGEAAKTREARP